MKDLLSKIKLDSKYLSCFDNASYKASYNKTKNLLTIEVFLDNYIEPLAYVSFYNKLNEFFKNIYKDFKLIARLHVKNNEYNLMLLKDYINYYIDNRCADYKEFAFIKRQGVSVRNDVLTIKYDDIFVEEALKTLQEKLTKFLNVVGFEKLSIDFMFVDKNDDFSYEDDKQSYQELMENYKKGIVNQVRNDQQKSNFRPSFKDKNFIDVELDNIPPEVSDIRATVKVFDCGFDGKSTKVIKLGLTNFKTSYTARIWVSKKYDASFLLSLQDKYIKFEGTLAFNQYDKENAIDLYNIEVLDIEDEKITDDEENKRVELHLHTNMSAMDGISSINEYINLAASLGHKAIALTDHVAVQSFPEAQIEQKALKKKDIDIKIIYGIEINTAPRRLDIVKNKADISLKDATYVFFDLETTGLSCKFDEIIEFGAVKVKNNVIIDRIDLLIKPKSPVRAFTTELTSISNEMLSDKPSIEEVLPKIMAFIGSDILVAHNASFDVGFIEHAIKKKLENPIIDTLPLSQYLYRDLKNYRLGTVCKNLGVDYDEVSAHRGDYDAEVLKDAFFIMLDQMLSEHIASTHQELDALQSAEVTRKMHPYHTTLLATSDEGIKNIYKILSIANTDYFTSQALVPPHVVDEHREGIIVGSSCARGEIYEIASTKDEEALLSAMEWYDYIEIQPLDQYQILVDTDAVESIDKVKMILEFIISSANKLNKLIVATGDCHYAYASEHIAREVFISTPAIGGGYHPLHDYKGRIKKYPVQEYKTTRQMLDAFSWLGTDRAYEYVVTNTNKLADSIPYLYPTKSKLYPPSIPGSDQSLVDLCYKTAHELYGENLPEIVSSRLEKELKIINDNGYSIMYVIASRCVKQSAKEGFLVGSRGSVGSSFVATCSGITEVNPLPPHYRCPHCKYSTFEIDKTISSGYDLPDHACPNCGNNMIGDGQNIPFETFLGFSGDKVPDIDLNFSALNQDKAHLFIREMFGEDKVFRAGTIATAATKTAFGYAKKYYEKLGINISNAEAGRIAKMCEGVKRTTGQHPGGLIVIPKDMEVYDFTPIGHPADDITTDWLTTHYAFEYIHDNVLKLDMLGHVDPTAIRMLEQLTGIDPHTIPTNDVSVLEMFNGDEMSQDPNKLTAIGLPEFGTQTSRRILIDAKPKTFADLIKVSGLSHGTDVYFGNARDLIIDGTCTISNCIGCRDDIMVNLIDYGIDNLSSFKIMESVRKGRGLTEEQEAKMREHNVPDWYIAACKKIKYMFPKAHAAAYCLMSYRIAWFKKYYPIEYYATYFSTRSDAFDIEAMIAGGEEISKRFHSLLAKKEKGPLTTKEADLLVFYEVATEMYIRGYSFSNIDLERSLSIDFAIDKENNTIIPPFRVCDGLGESAGDSIVEARKDHPFLSKDDLVSRTKINQTILKKLELLGVLKDLNDTDQLTLFSF